MILADYESFCGQPPTVVYDDGALHAVSVPLERLGHALALWSLSTAVAFEVILDARSWVPGETATVECPDGPCVECHQRGWLPIDYTDTLMVFTGTAEGVETTMFHYAVGDDGRPHFTEPKPSDGGVGPIPALCRAAAEMPKHPRAMAIGDLLTVWREFGYGKVLT